VKGQVMLSPLRFHYDSQQFNLPIRLGLMNSKGTQDLLVHILSPGQRFEAANYTNVTIPTNLDVADATRASFPAFYASLFDATMAVHKGAVVTEYSWDAASCDPCPVPPLEPNDLATLGGDVMSDQSSFVLTRLHARDSADSLGDDLVFRAAPPVIGGRESMGPDGNLERGAQQADVNNFQARYVIRHPWKGAVACENPQRGVWGGPPGDGAQPPVAPAQQIAFAPRNQPLSTFLRQDVAEIDYKVSRGDPKTRFQPSGIQKGGCAGCRTSGTADASLLAVGGLLALGAIRRRRRMSRPS
jgi:MYXO-CTERM domain-containing protein